MVLSGDLPSQTTYKKPSSLLGLDGREAMKLSMASPQILLP